METLAAGAEVNFKVFSPKIHARQVHFVRSVGTRPCYANHALCEGGHDANTVRWYGYLFGFHINMNKTAFLQLTLEGARQLQDQVKAGADLRGILLRATRSKAKNGRVTIRVETNFTMERIRILPDIAPDPSLYKLWKIKAPPPLILPMEEPPADDWGETDTGT